MQLWHISFSTTNRLPLFSTEALRRKAVRALVASAGQQMALFSVVDEHVHLTSIGDEEQTRRLRQSIHQRLDSIAEAPIAGSWAGLVKDRRHLLRLVRYHLFQVVKHNVRGADPALWSGSCFQDLVGARCIEGLELQLALLLPRQNIVELARAEVGLHGPATRPVESGALRRLGVARIKAAAAAASAVDPKLQGRSMPEMLARRATAHLSVAAQISTREIRWELGLTRQGISAALSSEAPQTLMRATLIRLSLEIEIEQKSASGARWAQPAPEVVERPPAVERPPPRGRWAEQPR